MYKTAMYPGTFDPITNGHLDIIRRASLIFERVIVAVAQSANKKPQFSLEERIEMIQKSTSALGKVQVLGFCGLLADFATAPLEVYDLALAQELDDLVHIGIVAQAEDIIVSSASLLLSCHIVHKIGDRVAH